MGLGVYTRLAVIRGNMVLQDYTHTVELHLGPLKFYYLYFREDCIELIGGPRDIKNHPL